MGEWVVDRDNLVARLGEGGIGTSRVNSPQREKCVGRKDCCDMRCTGEDKSKESGLGLLSWKKVVRARLWSTMPG